MLAITVMAVVVMFGVMVTATEWVGGIVMVVVVVAQGEEVEPILRVYVVVVMFDE